MQFCDSVHPTLNIFFKYEVQHQHQHFLSCTHVCLIHVFLNIFFRPHILCSSTFKWSQVTSAGCWEIKALNLKADAKLCQLQLKGSISIDVFFVQGIFNYRIPCSSIMPAYSLPVLVFSDLLELLMKAECSMS